MDEAMTRPRYPRRSVPTRKRRRSVRSTNSFTDALMRQIVIALALLVVIGVLKSVNTPVTNFLSDKVRYVSTKDINIKEAYAKVSSFMSKISGSTGKDADKNDADSTNVQDDTSVPASSDVGGTSDKSLKDTETDTGENGDEMQEDTSAIVESIKKKYTFTTPVEGAVSSPFGKRVHPAWKTESFHTGVDIDAGKGTPIKAALDGKVIEAGKSTTYGNYIKIEHKDGIVTLYGHCSELLVKKDQNVPAGKIIAKVGNTGVSVGSHLHFEVWKDETVLDPINFIKVSG